MTRGYVSFSDHFSLKCFYMNVHGEATRILMHIDELHVGAVFMLASRIKLRSRKGMFRLSQENNFIATE
jgi:hypothetical protein